MPAPVPTTTGAAPLLPTSPGRRQWLRQSFGTTAALLFAPMAGGLGGCGTAASPAVPRLGFRGVPPGWTDAVVVPEGYVATPIAAWGEPVGLPGAMPPWREDASDDAAAQAAQLGMHHDGLVFVPLEGSRRGLLVINHEYTDDGLLHPGGMEPWTAAKVAKAQAAQGLSVVEVVRAADGSWQLVRPSPHARRITATTPCQIAGPAAGHALMRTAADPDGRQVRGTLANCASSLTPWGTVLSGEENFSFYFDAGDAPDADARRWDLQARGWTRWGEHDERFDLRRHPHEVHRFGWIVEVDPLDPAAAPVKRTALGRATHEGATVAVTRGGRAVLYMGEDARFERLYKFVSRDAIAPARAGLSAAQANRELLDHGTLYAARFDADGRGRWLPLRAGEGPLTAAGGFPDQATVLVRLRQAADAVGATRLDRPEWVAVDPLNREVLCSLTNNNRRGRAGQPDTDAANPRAENTMGQILRWQEDGDFDGETFSWRHLLLAGDPANERPQARGDIRGDAFACPDGLAIDARGVLWIQTDVSSAVMGRGEFARLGHNQMLACDPRSGEVRRFLTGPPGAEITGLAWTPDGCTMFVDIQHPGEPPDDRSDPARPDAMSTWPDHRPGGRPRSATLVIRRMDGGVIGA